MSASSNEFGPPERVYVESDWYDGPRAGVADVDGAPHRFKALFDETDDDYLGTFLVWPINHEDLALEIEQWRIFVEWNTRYEADLATVASHPGHGGVSRRYDEIDATLRASRKKSPPTLGAHGSKSSRSTERAAMSRAALTTDCAGVCYEFS